MAFALGAWNFSASVALSVSATEAVSEATFLLQAACERGAKVLTVTLPRAPWLGMGLEGLWWPLC